ncbi:Golgi resident protein GCP60 [Anthonomus grandis grandis]|uniref:Golgi resident protein GCP60 n=1 Tax=Anthonomus grandis grandis TaxID=2921223 RepID=UPI002166A134|nr:Golgi resident protein GCP60 [Anthonomus grandis grandis]
MAEENSDVAKNLKKLSLNGDTNVPYPGNGEINNLEDGLPLAAVYKLALSFYKEKVGKAFHFSYEDNLQLIAFSQQVAHGPLAEAIDKLPPLGTLDVVGKDRREAWQKLGQLSKDQAKRGFVELLSRRCPLFSTYIEAHRRERDEQKRLEKEELTKKIEEDENKRKQEEEQRLLLEKMQEQEAIKRQIQLALNQQTYDQFRKYAMQQYPGDPEKQGNLIRQLQEQHYVQYMQQLELSQKEEATSDKKPLENQNIEQISNETIEEQQNISNITESEQADRRSQADENEYQISTASMWTLPDIEAFKQRVSQTEGDGVVRVGHGETVTVRVPTHPEGSRLFWEFATDHYDIGFGIYFEFGTPMTDEVSVHVSESDDEEVELDEEELYDETIRCDLESGGIDLSSITKPTVVEIVPVYRRDCQTEVYAGSHPYPGKGVYLLKFDNSYSLWRSKTLYYRVYYTQN